jgi:tetratricopeptide (TPR) repeat protein
VLFLGAGVSVDSGAPTGRQLADELGTKFLSASPGTYPFEEAADLVISAIGRKPLNEWLAARFSPLLPAGALLLIPKFRWKSIYTVNYDTLLETAYAQDGDRLQNLRPFYSDKDPLGSLKEGEVPMYKLHGCLSRANSEDGRLILTQEDLASVHERRHRLFNRLLDEMSDFTVLYAGFRREDADFTRILIEVGQSVEDIADLPRSYALQPKFTDFDRQRWERKRVTLVDGTASDFFGRLDEAVPVKMRQVSRAPDDKLSEAPLRIRKPTITAELLAALRPNFEIIDEAIRKQDANIDDFFIGAPANWGLIASGADAERDVKDDILASVLVDPVLDRKAVQFVLVHSEAGTGKSTLLRRIGKELALDWNHVVIALKPFGTLEFLDVERLARTAGERVYLLVDEATGVARELSQFLRSARLAKAKVTVVAAARTNEWREAQEDNSALGAEEVELGPLSLTEIKGVLKTLTAHGKLGLLAGVSMQAQLDAFQSRANKQLLVALREATDGRKFDEIVIDEFDRIPSVDAQRAYLLVAALHRLGILTRAGLLHRALGIPIMELGDRVFSPTTKVIIPQDVLGDDEPYYSTRHMLIATIVYDRKVPNERRSLEYYAELIRNLDLGYSSDADAYRKLTRGKNRQLLRDFKDSANKRELMRELIKVDPTDAYTYQHAAMMELEQQNLAAAAKYLERANELRPGDPAIRDTEGLLALSSAMAEQDPMMANDKFGRAEAIFRRNIQREQEEPYGYRHLAQTYAQWATLYASNQDKELHYIGLAYENLLKGLEKSRSLSMLLQYLGQLEEKFGNPDRAREAFGRALREKPSDVITRFMAARLEERDRKPDRALEILEKGLDYSADHPELHSRIATLAAQVQPNRDADIRAHFEAALLGPFRNYWPRLAYAAYLFSRQDYAKSHDEFARLEELVVPGTERMEIRRFKFGRLVERFSGRVRRVSFGYSSVEVDKGATEVYFASRQLSPGLMEKLTSGTAVTFSIGFNLKGPIAIDLLLD